MQYKWSIEKNVITFRRVGSGVEVEDYEYCFTKNQDLTPVPSPSRRGEKRLC